MISKIIIGGLLGALLASATPTSRAKHPKPTRNGTQTINGLVYAGGVVFGEDLKEISAEITVPECSVGQPFSPYTTYESDGWIGLGAYSYEGLVQTGITCYVSNGTAPNLKIWSEWYPALETFYDDTDFQTGDVISARVVAHSKTSATTYLNNKRTGKMHSTTYTNQTKALTFGDAEWVVESRLSLTILGPEGHFDAKYTPWQFHDAEYVVEDLDDNKHGEKKHKFELNNGSHLLDAVIGGYKISEGLYDGPGHIQVNDTTPANYTVPGFYGY